MIVEYLADNLAAERALCAVTVRDDGPSLRLELARSLQARRVSPVLALAPLDRQEVAAMVGSCLGSSTVPDEVVEFAGRADGVRFMAEELLAAALTSGALIDERGSCARLVLEGARRALGARGPGDR
jgi:hypothetical protein